MNGAARIRSRLAHNHHMLLNLLCYPWIRPLAYNLRCTLGRPRSRRASFTTIRTSAKTRNRWSIPPRYATKKLSSHNTSNTAIMTQSSRLPTALSFRLGYKYSWLFIRYRGCRVARFEEVDLADDRTASSIVWLSSLSPLFGTPSRYG
jgi:hypothetical protein